MCIGTLVHYEQAVRSIWKGNVWAGQSGASVCGYTGILSANSQIELKRE